MIYLGAKSGNDKNHTEKMETADPDKVRLSINTEKQSFDSTVTELLSS